MARQGLAKLDWGVYSQRSKKLGLKAVTAGDIGLGLGGGGPAPCRAMFCCSLAARIVAEQKVLLLWWRRWTLCKYLASYGINGNVFVEV